MSMTVYVVILAASVGLLVLSIILDGIFDFLDGAFEWLEGIFDFGDAEVGGDVTPFNIRVFFAGLMGFGLGGALATNAGIPGGLAATIAFASFFLFAALIYLLVFKPLASIEGSSDYRRTSFVGITAQVTSGIPENGSGMVQLTAPGTNTIVAEPARSATQQRIATGTRVRIQEVTPGGVVVVPDDGNNEQAQ
jgi:hypothetical protein